MTQTLDRTRFVALVLLPLLLFQLVLSVNALPQDYDYDEGVETPPEAPTPVVQSMVTVTAPAITARPTRKFSKPLPACILACLQKAVTSAGCHVGDEKCACVNPMYQVTSQTCIKYTCAPEDQELAEHVQQKCGEHLEIRPTFHPDRTIPDPASLSTNIMAVMTGKAYNAAVPAFGIDTFRLRLIYILIVGLGPALVF